MNQIRRHTDEAPVKAANLPDWLLSHGISSVSTTDVSHLLAIPKNHVSQRMASLRKKGAIATPARGLWIPVPPEYRTWGAPDPAAYLDDMMRYLDSDYCVGWLSAAALHGASHHAAQVFQVATDKQVRSRSFGRAELQFYQRGYLASVSTTSLSLPLGRMRVASVAATMLMACDDIALCGGIDNVANVVIELFEEADDTIDLIEDICGNIHAFSSAASRRLGWLLENFTDCAELDELAIMSMERNSSLSVLSPQSDRGGSINKRWHLEINREVVPDV